MKNHIVHVSNDFYPNTGGINTHLLNLLSTKTLDSYRFTLLVPTLLDVDDDKKDDISREMKNGIDLFRVYYRAKNKVEEFFAIKDAVYKGLEEIRHQKCIIDLIHQHDHRATRFAVTRYAKIHSLPLIWTNHLSDFFSLKEWPVHLFWKTLGYLPDGMIAVHQTTADKIKNSAWYDLPVQYIPNGVGIDFYRDNVDFKNTTKTKTNTEKLIRVFFPQRIVWEKGPLVLAHAVCVLKKGGVHAEIEILFAGSETASNRDENLSNRVKEILRKHVVSGEVKFIGNPDYSEMPLLYHQSDIVVLPLLKETENISVFEAWASGSALIVTDVLASNGYVQHGVNALVVPAKNPQKLADAIELLAQDIHLRKSLCDNGNRIVQELFTWEKSSAATKKFYEKILRKRGNFHEGQ